MLNSLGIKLKLIELVELAKIGNEELFAKVSDRQAVAMVSAVLEVLAEEIEEAEESLRVAGFGTFKVREHDVEKEGKKETVRRVVFKPLNRK